MRVWEWNSVYNLLWILFVLWAKAQTRLWSPQMTCLFFSFSSLFLSFICMPLFPPVPTFLSFSVSFHSFVLSLHLASKSASAGQTSLAADFQSWQRGYLMTRLVGIRLNGIHSGIHRGHRFESTQVAPLFLSTGPRLNGDGGCVGKQPAGSSAEVGCKGPSVLRRLLRPGPVNYAVRGEICFSTVGERATAERREVQEGRLKEGGMGWGCRAADKRRGWGVVSGGELLSVTHDGCVICPRRGSDEEERTRSHCEAVKCESAVG